jgi:molecular chaperone GrpE
MEHDDGVSEQGALAPSPEPPGSIEPPAPDADSSLRALADRMERLDATLATGLAQVRDEFQAKLAYDASKQQQIDRLHAEVQEHRADLFAKITRPVFLGLIRMHDDIGKVLAAVQQLPPDEWTPERLVRHLGEVREDVELLLGQHGVEKFEGAGDAFDPRRQTALRTVPSEDPGQVGRLAGRLRPGFETTTAVLQKERVAVYAADGGKA